MKLHSHMSDHSAAFPWPMWLFGCAVFTGILILAAPFDLDVSQRYYDSANSWAIWVRYWGTMPNVLLYGAAVIYLVFPRLRRRSILLQVIAVTILLMALLHPLLMTQSIKLLWGRLRFVELQGDWSIFTPFYMINKPFASESFPSGHVASACVFLPIGFFLFRAGLAKAALILFASTAFWAALIAYARIVAGAHYLTDTIFSIGSSLLLAPLSARWGETLWRSCFSETKDTTL